MGEAEKEYLEEPVIRVGVSECLLGERVRYDGGHKLDRYLTGAWVNSSNESRYTQR